MPRGMGVHGMMRVTSCSRVCSGDMGGSYGRGTYGGSYGSYGSYAPG